MDHALSVATQYVPYMTPPNEPSESTINAEAARVAGTNCREFYNLTELTYGVPDLISPVPILQGTAQARQLLTSLFPPDAKVCVAVSMQESKVMEVGRFQLRATASPCGAWFKVNRLTSSSPSGRKGGWTDNDCATELIMIEMDSAPKPEQLLFWRGAIALGFPVVSITDSAGKSLHVIIRVNVNALRTFQERSRQIYSLLAIFLPDPASGNASRFTRLPGIMREMGDIQKEQKLLYLNPGAPVWQPGCSFSQEVEIFSRTAEVLPEPIRKRVSARENRNRDPLTEEEENKQFRKRFDNLHVHNGVELDAVINELGWDIDAPTTSQAGEFKQYIKCPWHGEHSYGGAHDGPTDAYIYRRGTAAKFPWGFHCSHSSCCNVYRGINLMELLREEHSPVLDRHLIPFPEVADLFPDDMDTDEVISAAPSAETPASPPAGEPEEDEDGDEETVEAIKGSNDVDNAAIFVKKYKDRVRYLHDEGTWLIWNGKRWKRDVTEYIVELGDTVSQMLIRRATNDPEMRIAKQAGNVKAIEQMLKKARVRKGIKSSSDKFDTDPWLLGCPNGTLNLQTGEFRAARPQDRITRSLSVPYDPSAVCPRWDEFVRELHPNDPQVTSFLRRFFGYTLTGSVGEQVMLIFLGHGCNGKSTLTKHLQEMMGEYAVTCPKSLLLSPKNGESEGASPEVIGLKGARMGTVAETDPGVSLSDSRIKLMVGGEKVTGRKLYGDFQTFSPEAKLILSTNHTPRVKGNDVGIWRRLLLVEFKENFDKRRDPMLDHFLEKERAGILNWALRGWREYQDSGLQVPASVLANTEEYRRSEDYIGIFIEERLEMTPSPPIAKGAVYDAYKSWAHSNGCHTMQSQTLSKVLMERGAQEKRTGKGRFWTNLVLKDEILSD